VEIDIDIFRESELCRQCLRNRLLDENGCMGHVGDLMEHRE